MKTGCVIVDAPGVNDDNSARNNIVQSYLKEADSIWIVSNINRAVNDKTAKDMLDHKFRRQLYGRFIVLFLSFVSFVSFVSFFFGSGLLGSMLPPYVHAPVTVSACVDADTPYLFE